MPKPKLNYWYLSNRVWSVKKTRQDNDMPDCIGTIYAKNEIELSWPIGSGTICDQSKIGQWCDQSIGSIYVKTETKLLGPI